MHRRWGDRKKIVYLQKSFDMKTFHHYHIGNSKKMSAITDNAVDLVVTSPPYPMIEMWDDIMANQNKEIKDSLISAPDNAFELMHQELDKVWQECFRVIKPGGFLCINIGDATRTINGRFKLYNNHSRIISSCLGIGFVGLPNIIWRKQTNAPNKFMGSGMLPCGAYVTLEHEWILIFRKGDKRIFKEASDKQDRSKSAFFWEERNIWFSDVWEIKGTKQSLKQPKSRERSAAYPLEVPYRLINMYSQIGDTVLDPFVGTGTTMQAAILLGRNSIGYDIDQHMGGLIATGIGTMNIDRCNDLIKQRFDNHVAFIKERKASGKDEKQFNMPMNVEVMTKQEETMELCYLKGISLLPERNGWMVEIEDHSHLNFLPVRQGLFAAIV